MAQPIVFEIKADTSDAVKDLDKVEKKLDKVGKEAEQAGDKAKKSGDGWGSMGAKAAGAAIAITATVVAVKAAVAAFQEFATEWERQAGVINRFTGDITEASDRVNGLTSNLALMASQQVLITAGIQASAHDFANLAVAAEEMSAQSDGATQSLDALVKGLATGGEEIGSALGIKTQLAQLSDVADKQALIFATLEERYGDVESSADTLAGQALTLGTQVDNLTTAVVESVQGSADFDRVLADLADTFDRLGVGIPTLTNEFTEFSDLITAALIKLTQTIANVARAFDDMAAGNFLDAVVGLTDGTNFDTLVDRVSAERRRREEVGAFEAELARLATSGGVSGGDGSTPTAPGTGRGRGGRGGGGPAGTFEFGVAGSIAGGPDMDAVEREREAFEALVSAKEGGIAVAEKLRDVNAQAAREEEEAAIRLTALQEEKLEAQNKAAAQQKQLVSDTLNTTLAAGDMLVEGFAETQGQMELWRGISDAAQAISSFAGQNYASGALYLISSALHFKSAAEMGLGGGGGGQGAAAGGRGLDGQRGGGQQASTEQNVTVNINSPVSERDIGRMQKNTERQYSQRFNSRL